MRKNILGVTNLEYLNIIFIVSNKPVKIQLSPLVFNDITTIN